MAPESYCGAGSESSVQAASSYAGELSMEQFCFVIQPFDNGPYDKLFKETCRPAIIAAGFEPYRVDEDPSASIPIEQIEKKIREAAFCFAEITADNPNVWFELARIMQPFDPLLKLAALQQLRFRNQGARKRMKTHSAPSAVFAGSFSDFS
jgi:hypothetical protein